MTSLPCPHWADFWTLDEVAECLEYYKWMRQEHGDTEGRIRGDALYKKLWVFMGEVKKEDRTPLGGDGSDGTTEEPIADKAEDALALFWDRLEEEEKTALQWAWAEELGNG